jgi:hypothetical protein
LAAVGRWATNPHPILGSLAQSFANRIHQDVASFLFEFVMIAQPVIEKIALPIHAMFSSDEFFPVLDGRCHSWLTRERNNRVQSTASPVSARHSWFLPGGTQLIVIKNQLPLATHCGIV